MDNIDERFHKWSTDNPHVVTDFIALALEAKSRGFERHSADSLMHVLRWKKRVRANEGGYGLNDHFTSRLARLAMQREPSLAGFFETRTTKAEKVA